MANQSLKTQLTGVGCPAHVADQVAAANLPSGVTAGHLTRLASAAASAKVNLNWLAILQLLPLLQSNGPAIIDAIIALFSSSPAPAPAP